MLYRMLLAAGFTLDDTNLEHRLRVPSSFSVTISDEGSRGGLWFSQFTVTNFMSYGKQGYGLITDSSHTCSRSAPTWMSSSQDCTIMWWANVAPGETNTSRAVNTGANSTNASGHEIDAIVTSATTQSMVRVGDGAGTGASHFRSAEFDTSSVGDLRDNTWHHMAYTFSGADTQACYVDGASLGSPTLGGTGASLGFDGSATMYMNATNFTDTTKVAWGNIADFRIYSEQLSATRIARIAGLIA